MEIGFAIAASPPGYSNRESSAPEKRSKIERRKKKRISIICPRCEGTDVIRIETATVSRPAFKGAVLKATTYRCLKDGAIVRCYTVSAGEVTKGYLRSDGRVSRRGRADLALTIRDLFTDKPTAYRYPPQKKPR